MTGPTCHRHCAPPRPATWGLALSALAAAGCTTLGVPTGHPTPAAGPPVALKVCMLREPSVADARIADLVAAANAEFAPHGIRIDVPWVRPWKRPGFTYESIIDDLRRRPLEAPCDRLMAVVVRTPGDFLWALFLPEVVGGVENGTRTRGFSPANAASIGQLVQRPEETFVHELHHMLGCGHRLSLRHCRARIASLRARAGTQSGFFPTLAWDRTVLTSRAQVDARLGHRPPPGPVVASDTDLPGSPAE